MSRDVRDALATRTDDFEIRRALHEMPPHEVHEVEYEGSRAVCKVSLSSRGSAGVEGRILRRLARETTISVSEILTVGSDFFVAEYREDAPEDFADDEKRLEEAWLRTAGRTLGRLHAETGFDRPGLLAVDGDPGDSEAGLRVDADEGASWSDALDDLLGVYHDVLRGTEYRAVVTDAREFFDAYADRFDVLDGRDPAVLHGWFSPDHVAVDGDEARCVIDFEHSLAGSGEWDYWRTAVPLFGGHGWERPDRAEELFRAGYESVRSFPSDFDRRERAYRAFVAVSHLDSLHTQRGIDDDTREMADFMRNFVSEALDELRDEWG